MVTTSSPMTTVGTLPVSLEWRMSSARQSARVVASRSSKSRPSARMSSRASAQYGQLGLTYMMRSAMTRQTVARASAGGVRVAGGLAGVAVAVGVALGRAVARRPGPALVGRLVVWRPAARMLLGVAAVADVAAGAGVAVVGLSFVDGASATRR